jgi:plasmid maintenance system killer protein
VGWSREGRSDCSDPSIEETRLRGKRSIRINKQWRIVFRWTASGPEDVEIDDYHE